MAFFVLFCSLFLGSGLTLAQSTQKNNKMQNLPCQQTDSCTTLRKPAKNCLIFLTSELRNYQEPANHRAASRDLLTPGLFTSVVHSKKVWSNLNRIWSQGHRTEIWSKYLTRFGSEWTESDHFLTKSGQIFDPISVRCPCDQSFLRVYRCKVIIINFVLCKVTSDYRIVCIFNNRAWPIRTYAVTCINSKQCGR